MAKRKSGITREFREAYEAALAQEEEQRALSGDTSAKNSNIWTTGNEAGDPIADALRKPLGLAGKPYPVGTLPEPEPQNPLVVYSTMDPALFRGLPVPSMMTAMFNDLRLPEDSGLRRKFLFG